MGGLEDRLILENMDDLGRPQGSYPESFVLLSLFLADRQRDTTQICFFSSKNVTDRDSDRHTLLNFNIDVVRMKSYKYCISSQLYITATLG